MMADVNMTVAIVTISHTYAGAAVIKMHSLKSQTMSNKKKALH